MIRTLRCRYQDAYRWLRGGVAVSDHTLGDFRSEHHRALGELFTRLLGVLARWIDPVDGIRAIRSDIGSYRRLPAALKKRDVPRIGRTKTRPQRT